MWNEQGGVNTPLDPHTQKYVILLVSTTFRVDLIYKLKMPQNAQFDVLVFPGVGGGGRGWGPQPLHVNRLK